MLSSVSHAVSKALRWSTLSEECEVIGGGTPKRSNPNYFGGGIPWATPTDVTGLSSLYICQTKETVTPEGVASSSTKLLPAGAVLLTSRATIGFTAIAEVPICTNQGFANFICGANILPEYLAYWLPTQRNLMLRESGETTFKEISKGALKRFKIPVPPLEEQRRIVDTLKRADSIRRLRKQAIDIARQLIPALFIDMFGDPATNPKGWPEKSLGNLVSLHGGGTPSKKNPAYWGGVIPWVSPKDMKSDCIWDSIDHVTPKALEETTLKWMPAESVLIVVRGMILMHTVPIRINSTKVTINQDMKVLVPNEELSANYLRWTLQCMHSYILSQVSTSAHGTRKLDTNRLMELRIPLPQLSMQKEFEIRLDSIQSIKHQQEDAWNSTESAFQSLLSRAFSE